MCRALVGDQTGKLRVSRSTAVIAADIGTKTLVRVYDAMVGK